jgi:aminoglycoside phosphotransferase (APT) family kinase protein
MADRTLDLDALLAHVNAHHGTRLQSGGAYRRGENQGAYPVVMADGTPLILKCAGPDPHFRPRLERAQVITGRLRDLGAPVPRYLLIGDTPDGTRYWVQEALPGEPVGRLTRPEQVDRLLAINDFQAGQAVSSEQNWTSYVVDVVFRGGSGWADELRQYGEATASLVSVLAELTAGQEACCQRTADIVHGDLSPGNILALNGQISGIVDWDAAGCGDRAFDLALLLFYHYDDPPIRTPLRDRALALAGPDALRVYLAYAILGQTTWSSRHHGQSAVEHWLSRAGRIVHDLRGLS